MLSISFYFQRLLPLILILATAPAKAQKNYEDAPGAPERPNGPPDFIAVGGAVSAGSLIYSGGGFQANPFPIIAFKKGRFFSNRAGVGFELFESNGFRLSALTELAIDERNRNDVGALNDLPSVNIPLYGGLSLDAPIGAVVATATVQRELGLASEGWRAIGLLSYPMRYGRELTLTPSVAFQWSNDRLTNYLFGVDAASATPGRPPYDTGSSFKATLGATATYQLTDRFILIASVSSIWHSDAIVDSPIVNERLAFGSFLSLAYSF